MVLLAAAVALVVSLLGTPAAIRVLAARGYGQLIRDDGPTTHHTKRGTPTMGGAVILLATVAGYAVAHLARWLPPTPSGVLVLVLVVGLGIVGFLDDWIKVSRQRSLGLKKMAKTVGLVGVALLFAVLAVYKAKVRTDLSFTRSLGVSLVDPVYIVWAVLILIGTANAVNLSDGLDGLAAGSSIFAFAAFVFVGFWQFRHPDCYAVGPALDLSLVAAALTGACAGFLWWNAAPARIFMGDTGSLAIGAALGALALTTNTQLLLPVVGGLFVMVTLSVAVQIAAFRLFGRRVFRMAPIHHHFELLGWPETTVIVRFWVLAGLCAALAVGLFYADFLSNGCRAASVAEALGLG